MKDSAEKGIKTAQQAGQLRKDAAVQGTRAYIKNPDKSSSGVLSNTSSTPNQGSASGSNNSTTRSSSGISNVSTRNTSRRMQNKQTVDKAISVAKKIPVARKYAKMAEKIQKIKSSRSAGFFGSMMNKVDNKSDVSGDDIEEAARAEQNGEEYKPDAAEARYTAITGRQMRNLVIFILAGIVGGAIFFCVILVSSMTTAAGAAYLASKSNPTEDELTEWYSNQSGDETSNSNVTASGTLNADGTRNSDNDAPSSVYEISSEPKPWFAINYWNKQNGSLNKDDFVYPTDKDTKLPLGAWPKDYKNIPTQLSGCKIYQGSYIWPATPSGGKYEYVYEHNGIDVMADFGTPIYSPVDGKLVYSEWGGTVNKGSDETSYSVTITPNKVVTFDGTKIDEIFMTHMSGIRYRCPSNNCNRSVKAGELIGFVGTAAGSSTTEGYASHVHITLYPSSNYSDGLRTPQIEKFYNISAGASRKACE